MFKYIVILLLFIELAYNLALMALSSAQKNKPLPRNVADIYDAVQYQNWKNYSADLKKLGGIEAIVSFIFMAVLFFTDAFAWLYDMMPGGVWARNILFLLIFAAVEQIVFLPFSYIRNMKIEEKYGFNRSTMGTFVADCIKGFVLNTVINIILFSAIQGMYSWLGKSFFIAAYAIIAVFIILINMFSSVFSRIYNKITPLENEELRAVLTEMFEREGYHLENIYVMDASRRTTKVNAYCSGMGKFKKIVLYDNLVNNYTTGEIAAVFAHELGHYKHRDVLKLTAFSLINMLVMLGSISLFILFPQIRTDFGFAEVSVGFAMLAAMGAVIGPVSKILGLASNGLTRRFEYRADKMAFDSGWGDDLVSSLKKLSKDNLADLNPHPAVVVLEYNHPSISQRIDALDKLKAERK